MQDNIKKIYDSIKTDPIFARDIVISDLGPWVYVSENELFCFTGVLMKGVRRDILLYQTSYKFFDKHSFDEIVVDQTKGFFRLSQGAIFLEDFIDKSYNDNKLFKRLLISIRLPVGTDTRYGIYYKEDTIDEEIAFEIERQIFGLTARELEDLLIGYSEIFGTRPRLTRYQRMDNYCDLCEMWIPKSFPYLIFKESGSDFSHISLWGGYRYFQLLMQNSCSSPISRLLIENGVSKNIIDKVLEIHVTTNHFMKPVLVTKSLIYSIHEK